MTPDPPPIPAPGPAPAPAGRPALARWVGAAVRLALVAAILAAGFALLDLYRTLFTDVPGGAPIPEHELPAPAATGLPDAMLADGSWTVGDSGWAAKTSQITPEELEARLSGVGEPLPAGRPESDVERDLLRWVRENGRAEPPVAGCSVYRVSVNSAHVRVVTEVLGGRERVRLGQVVCPGSPGTASLVEITPAAVASSPVSPLLPLPAGVEVQARRWGGDRVAAELVGPWAEDRPLPAGWAAAGWVGKPLDPTGTAAGHLFERGGEAVQVWRFGVPGGGGGLLLIRGAQPGR